MARSRSEKMSNPDITPWDPPPFPDLPSAASSLVLDWFKEQFPDWHIETHPSQGRAPQSLMSALLPDLPQGPAGMVHFKDISDPLWLQGDLATLRGGFPWVLLVLNPFERFYELDPFIDELSAEMSQLVIWRPDRPTMEESAFLRVNSLVSPASSGAFAQKNNHVSGSGSNALQILSALYIQRGCLVIQGTRHAIHQEIGNLGLPRYLTACLSCLAPAVAIPREASQPEAEQPALHWSSLLCGQADAAGRSLFAGESQVLAWGAAHLDDGGLALLKGLKSMPEEFLTTRFREEVRWLEAAADRIRQILRCLGRREIQFVSAMAQMAQVFNGDEARLLHWRQIIEGMPAFLRWLPLFERSHAYLNRSFPTPDLHLEEIRNRLQAICTEPVRLLEAQERDRFDGDFDEFKTGYIRHYQSAHEDTVHIVSNREKMKARVDSVALRNLELLSDLDFSDRSHINRARALGKFLQANQCDLPVGEILLRQARCYCNFNPAGDQLLMQTIERMNEVIQEGISHSRAALRAHKTAIIQAIQNLKADDPRAKEIAALLSRGPMIPLRPPSLDLLNQILQKHPAVFATAGSTANQEWFAKKSAMPSTT